MLRLPVITTVALLAAQSTAVSLKRYDSLEPFYIHDPKTPSDCTLWWNSDDGLSCDTVLTVAGISVSQLTAMVSLTRNPVTTTSGTLTDLLTLVI